MPKVVAESLKSVLTRAWNDRVFNPTHIVRWLSTPVSYCYSVDPVVYYKPGRAWALEKRRLRYRHGNKRDT